MKPILADASAILAYLYSEPGWEQVEQHLPRIGVSAVNMAEVIAVLTLRGFDEEWIHSRVVQAFPRVLPFLPEQAILAGLLAARTKQSGLSLGDRACLAVGVLLNATVLTTDTAWLKLGLSTEIILIR